MRTLDVDDAFVGSVGGDRGLDAALPSPAHPQRPRTKALQRSLPGPSPHRPGSRLPHAAVSPNVGLTAVVACTRCPLEQLVDVRVRCYERMFTARATMSAPVTSEMLDCSIMASFDQRENGMVSVGLKAVALVKAR